MVQRGILEVNSAGDYRLKPIPKPDPDQAKRWVSPQIAEMLRKSGKQFAGLIPPDMDEEDYYNSL